MRCKACDVVLSDYEATLKSADTGEYFDLCSACLSLIEDDLRIIHNPELLGENVSDEDYDDRI